jgi:hypothetical protein
LFHADEKKDDDELTIDADVSFVGELSTLASATFSADSSLTTLFGSSSLGEALLLDPEN